MRPIHVLPHRQNDVVRGLASVRGELLVCVSIGNLLGVERQQVNKERLRDVYSRLIVIHGEGGRLVFPANEVHGILRFHTGDLREVPAAVFQVDCNLFDCGALIGKARLSVALMISCCSTHSTGAWHE